MSASETQPDYVRGTSAEATGSHNDLTEHHFVHYPFQKYAVVVELGPSNEFIAIVEIAVNKDFRSYRRETTPGDYHDVDEFYRE